MAARHGVLLDTGPLVAYLAADETHHAWVTAQLARLTGAIFTCEAVLGEAFFLLRHHPRHLASLRAMVADGVFDLSFHLQTETAAVTRLQARYADVPMSLADACMVRLSELHPQLPLLTLDGDFHIYRRNLRQLIPLLAPP